MIILQFKLQDCAKGTIPSRRGDNNLLFLSHGWPSNRYAIMHNLINVLEVQNEKIL